MPSPPITAAISTCLENECGRNAAGLASKRGGFLIQHGGDSLCGREPPEAPGAWESSRACGDWRGFRRSRWSHPNAGNAPLASRGMNGFLRMPHQPKRPRIGARSSAVSAGHISARREDRRIERPVGRAFRVFRNHRNHARGRFFSPARCWHGGSRSRLHIHGLLVLFPAIVVRHQRQRGRGNLRLAAKPGFRARWSCR